MSEKKRIALVAHTNRKQDLLEWARFNRELLTQHELYSTATTGKMLEHVLALQIEKLRSFKSKHSALACSFCHNVHGRIPDCTQCHKSHSADIVQKDCKACHKAHQPKNVAYKNDVPNKFCAACHKKAFTLLAASPAKHSKLACAYCHQAKHKTVPQCTQCHVKPHPAAILAKFNGKCGECHSIAHDLNHWSEKAAAPAATKAVEAKPVAKKPVKK